MMNVAIERLVPRFIMRDKNGYAMAKAIEKCVQIVTEAAENAMATFGDVDRMPSWRLDELAREWNMIYDFNAYITDKRRWVKNAWSSARYLGTPEAVAQHVGQMYMHVEVQEWWEYDGEPWHYRLIVDPMDAMIKPIPGVVEDTAVRAGNCRCVFDGVYKLYESTIMIDPSWNWPQTDSGLYWHAVAVSARSRIYVDRETGETVVVTYNPYDIYNKNTTIEKVWTDDPVENKLREEEWKKIVQINLYHGGWSVAATEPVTHPIYFRIQLVEALTTP